MSTPICNTCETKFPGKEICKTCGSDPNGEPNVIWRAQQTKIAAREVAKAVRAAAEQAERVKRAMRLAQRRLNETLALMAPEIRTHERRVERAQTRSKASTKRRGFKHGRVGVR